MELFRLTVSDLRSSKNRSKYEIARYAKSVEHLKAQLKDHSYLYVYDIKDVYANN